jgi:hypothetical protein
MPSLYTAVKRFVFAVGVDWLVGCASPPTDQARYLEVARDHRIAGEAGLSRCAPIGDPNLRADCSLLAASRAVQREPGGPERWCPQVPEGPYRDECWFEAAEWISRRNRKAGVERCLQSGSFLEDCAQHLWQEEARNLVFGAQARDFPEVMGEAQRIHDSWAPLLNAHMDFSDRYWARFFAFGFEQARGVDLNRCEALSGAHRERCRSAAGEVYGRELAPALNRANLQICDQPNLTSEDLVEITGSPADPLFDAVILRWRASFCAPSASAPTATAG